MRELSVRCDGAGLAASYSPAGDTAVVALHGASEGTREFFLYRHLHEDADRMVELARQHTDGGNDLWRRALNQAARELMLAQSSDWAFIMKTGTMVDYARDRTRVHLLNFNHLYEQLKRGEIDEGWLGEVERRHNLFPNLDYRVYA